MHRPKGTSDRGDPVEILGFNTPVGQISLNFIVLTKSKRYSIKSSKTNLFQTYAYHKITSVGRPILSGSRLVSFKYTPAREITSQASYRNNSPPPRTPCVHVAGVMFVSMVGSFCASKAQKPHPRGCPRGRNPLGLLSFLGFLCRSKEILIKSLKNRLR